MRRFWIKRGFAFIVFAPAVLAVLSLVVMLLWNALIPSLFTGPVLGFWQAAGLLVLCRVLFGGFRPHGRHHDWRARWRGMTPEERERFRDGFSRWKDMSREERREFRRGFGGRFGSCGPGMDEVHGTSGCAPDEVSREPRET